MQPVHDLAHNVIVEAKCNRRKQSRRDTRSRAANIAPQEPRNAARRGQLGGSGRRWGAAPLEERPLVEEGCAVCVCRYHFHSFPLEAVAVSGAPRKMQRCAEDGMPRRLGIGRRANQKDG